MSIAKGRRSLRNAVLIMLVAQTFLQPLQAAAFVNFQNRDWGCDQIRCSAVLCFDQIIQPPYEPLSSKKSWRTLKFLINGIMIAHDDLKLPSRTIRSRTDFTHNLNGCRGFFIWEKEKYSSHVVFLEKNDAHRITPLYDRFIALQIDRFEPREKFLQLAGDVDFKSGDGPIQGATKTHGRFGDAPKIKWSTSFLHNSRTGPNYIIGDVNLTGAPSFKPLRRSDFGICGDDGGLFGPKYDNKSIRARLERSNCAQK